MRTLKTVVFVSLVWLAAAPLGAVQAQLYKWLDENGVTNYGDAPPKDARKTTALDAAKSSLSVVPGLSKDELARLEARAEQARADRLERENAELRARLATVPTPAPRSDSSELAYAPLYLPQVVVRRRPPPEHRRLPMHGAPVQKTPPFAGMKLDR